MEFYVYYGARTVKPDTKNHSIVHEEEGLHPFFSYHPSSIAFIAIQQYIQVFIIYIYEYNLEIKIKLFNVFEETYTKFKSSL